MRDGNHWKMLNGVDLRLNKNIDVNPNEIGDQKPYRSEKGFPDYRHPWVSGTKPQQFIYPIDAFLCGFQEKPEYFQNPSNHIGDEIRRNMFP